MRRVTLSLITVLLASVQMWSQNDVFVKEMNDEGSRYVYKYIESFNKNKESLLKYSELEHPQLVESAHRIMDMGLAKANYLDNVKNTLHKNLSVNELLFLYSNKVRLFYTIDNEGNIYDVFFSIPSTVEQYILPERLEHIVKLIMNIKVSIDIDQYRSFFRQNATEEVSIWTTITITHGYWNVCNN